MWNTQCVNLEPTVFLRLGHCHLPCAPHCHSLLSLHRHCVAGPLTSSVSKSRRPALVWKMCLVIKLARRCPKVLDLNGAQNIFININFFTVNTLSKDKSKPRIREILKVTQTGVTLKTILINIYFFVLMAIILPTPEAGCLLAGQWMHADIFLEITSASKWCSSSFLTRVSVVFKEVPRLCSKALR